MKKIPVILTSFGNRKGSLEVQAFLEKRFREKFPDCEFHWALGSHYLQKLDNPALPPPPQTILHDLHQKGFETVLIQSLHIAPAAEYHKLLDLCGQTPLQIRTSPPLLSCRKDCKKAALALTEIRDLPEDTAALLILHGSSHEGGTIFHTMGEMFVETWGKKAFYGLLEGDKSGHSIVREIKNANFSKVHLIPFMLASSYHLEKDILGGKNSLKILFETNGIEVSVRHESLGLRPEIAGIFLEHLEKTLHQA